MTLSPQRKAAVHRAWSAAQAAAGRCTRCATGTPAEGRRRCERCTEANRVAQKGRAEGRELAGQCARCRRRVRREGTRCVQCATRDNRQQRARRATGGASE